MATLIDSHPEINYDDLHRCFEEQGGSSLSEAIGFLAVLHLCNEKNL